MKQAFVAAIAILTAGLLGPSAATAHHGLVKLYDDSKRVTVNGVIEDVAWINPHIYLKVVSVENGQQKIYRVESVPIAFARRAGITKAKLLGDGRPAQVTFMPSRTDPLLGWSMAIKYADGRNISFSGFNE